MQMKNPRSMKMFLVVALAAVIAAGNAQAQTEGASPVTSTSSSIRVAKGSKLWLEGDSTVHRYKADATQFRAELKTDAAGTELEALVRAGQVKSLVLDIPVSQLRSGKSDLDANMVKALKGSAHPSITFRMESYQVLPATDAAFALKLKGKLSIAGVEKPTELDAKVVRTPSGLQVIGSKELLMTDFSVKPPELMLGMMKTKNEVVVQFDLLLQDG